MNYNKLPSWLRGGIIGEIAAILIWAGYKFGFKIMLSSLSDPYPNVPDFIKWLSINLFTMVVPFGFGTGKTYRISQFIILSIVCCLVGIIVSLLIKKIKYKKS